MQSPWNISDLAQFINSTSEDVLKAHFLNGLLAPFVKPLDISDSILFHLSPELTYLRDKLK